MAMITLPEPVMEALPKAAEIAAIVLGGLLVSWIARRMTRWAVRKTGIDALAEKAGVAKLLYAVGARRGLDHVLGTVVWYAGLLLTAGLTAESAGLDAFASGVGTVVSYLPRVVAGLVVLAAGVALANILRKVVERFGKGREDVEQPQVLGTAAYYGTLVLSAIVAAGQAGLETELVESLLTTLVAIAAGAVAIAFALGSRESFHNLVAGHFLRRLARPGDKLELGDVQGTIVRYFGVCVVLDTRDGEVTLPCKAVLDERIKLQRLGAKARAQTAEAEPKAPPPPPTR